MMIALGNPHGWLPVAWDAVRAKQDADRSLALASAMGRTLVRRLDDGFRFALPILRIGVAWLSRRMGRAPAKPIAPPPLPSAAPDAGEKVARRGLSWD